MKRFFIVIIAVLNAIVVTMAKNQSKDSVSNRQPDSLEVSLLTCSPGEVAYAMYGHSAIRVHNLTSDADIVFNYGMFNYDEDNFIFKFVKGETDYVLGAEPADYFFNRYAAKGDGIYEQVLNLNQYECRKIFSLLMKNLEPVNRTYRYNWLYDNCTTRARDMIERAISGRVVYKSADQHKSARHILHQFAKSNRWVEFGENLVLGYELDTSLTKRQQMFIPSYYSADADSAVIERSDGTVIPMVKETKNPIVKTRTDNANTFDTPLWFFIVVMCGVAVISIKEIKRKKTFKWVDVVFQFIQGVAGLLVAFLFFFSKHAGVNSNMIVILLNPLAFIWIPFFIKRNTNLVSYVILTEIFAFVVTLIAIPQCYDVAFYPLVLTLLIREIVNICLNRGKSLSLQTNK